MPTSGSTTVTIRIPIPVAERVTELAKRAGITRNAWLTKAIMNAAMRKR